MTTQSDKSRKRSLTATAKRSSERSSISAFIVCFNEEAKIRQCLDSVSWCDEIVVVDSFSTDRTVEICREFSDIVLQRPWPGFVAQKRYALERCSMDWVLNIDADEVVSEELRQNILAILERDLRSKDSCNGYELRRVVYYLGRWWRRGGWHREYRLRLCRRQNTSWGGNDPHERAIVSGKTEKLNSELHHFSFDSIGDHLQTINKLSSVSAENMHARSVRFVALKMLGNPIARFLKFYFMRAGFREGIPGLIAAVLEALSPFLKYAKVLELRRYSQRPSKQLPAKNLNSREREQRKEVAA